MANPSARRWWTVIGLVAALLVGVVLAQLLPANFLGLRHDHGADAMAVEEDVAVQLYTCSMHPSVLQEEPGRCPICGMDLVAARGGEPVNADAHAGHDHAMAGTHGASAAMNASDMNATVMNESGAPTTVQIDPAVVQNMNVRTAPVERTDLTQEIRTVGYLEYDQQRMVTVTTKNAGWVEKVYVNYVGETVRKGQPLFEVYAPELVQTEEELLSALRFAREMSAAPEDARRRAESLVQSARTRLGYWDVSKSAIERLETTGEVFRTLTVTAPASGLVMMRTAGLEGMAIQPGMEIYHIANLSSLWLSAELFEEQMAWVREGSEARISFSYWPGEVFTGRVRFLEPALSEQTRTVRAMIEVRNLDGRLRKGMFATVEFAPVLVEQALVVPAQAVLRTGTRNLVVRALGAGRFQPREVTLGHETSGVVEVRGGLEEGDVVVTSSQFLLDSESTLREAIQRMIASRPESTP